ncbi:recombinase family protein [Streptomyces sp. NPDC059835]|uniref:recombinase family protein n=1 Tax=Streptomyces sp. NPDC059835 TaxID=3346967 RepID=UPI00364BDFB4
MITAQGPLGGYCRISDADLADIRRALRAGDITAEEAAELERKGVLKQRDDVVQLAAQFDREVIFYEDNNLSAFKRNVKRPKFLQMLNDLKAGRLGGIVVWDIDRFARQPKDLELAIDIYEEAAERKKHATRYIFETGSGQNFDLSTPDGRFSARLFVNIANKSSADTGRRIKRDNDAKARKGAYHGGTLAYGWDTEDREKLDSKAARLVNQAIDDRLAGDNVHTIMAMLYEAGALNPNTGKPFTWAGTKTLIFRPRNWGIRIHRGEPQLDADGNYIMGHWAPLCVDNEGNPDLDKFEMLKALQTDTIEPQDKTTVKYMLSRIVRCGRCMYPMVGKPVWIRGKKSQTFAYNCNKTHPDACGKMGVSGPRVDKLIQELVWAQVLKASKERLIEERTAPWENEAELQDVEEQIKELRALWDAKKVRAASYVTAKDDLEARRSALKAERAFSRSTPAIRAITPELLEKGWAGISTERQRKIIRTVLSAVIVHPSEGGKGGAFDPSRIEPVFVGQ